MSLLKKTGTVILFVIAIQTITFYTIGVGSIAEQIGENYESYVLDYEENEFEDIGVISQLNPSKEQVVAYFNKFKKYELKICTSTLDCSDLLKTDNGYLYWFDFETKHPFTINIIREAEAATEYGASWDSEYIWIICKWILIDKTNTGIS